MSQPVIYPVILSGGSGSRLWPLSRTDYPKQFLPLLNESSLFQATLRRVQRLKNVKSPLIISNEDHRFIVAEQARAINIKLSGILLEPFAKNTAPAITLAALHLISIGDSDGVMLILPSDHNIQNETALQEAIQVGANIAQHGQLITFGIMPTHPETGYGYIESEGLLMKGALKVKQFTEKPNLAIAKAYVESGRYFWNSGIFMFTANVLLQEMTRFHPDIVASCQAAFNRKKNDLDFIRIDPESFEVCPSISIDYAVMEKTQYGMVIPLNANWSDLGSWTSIKSALTTDVHGNTTQGDVISMDAKNNHTHAAHRLVTLLGVEDLLVIETIDVVMIAHKDNAQDVSKFVKMLSTQGRKEATANRRVWRPWGTYDQLCHGEKFQVKQITVRPGQKLSLQLHHHRAEHWVVLSGNAKVQIGEEIKLLKESESIFIPKQTIHSLENSGVIDLEIIEVQTGDYFGEDDIIRLEDIYGRS